MKPLDRFLQGRRIQRAAPYLSPADVVIDVGCADGAMFEALKGRFAYGYGIEPTLTAETKTDSYALYPGTFPAALPPGTTADRITLLAVLEHLSPPDQAALAQGCRDVLKPGGTIIITVPSPRVDGLLHVLGRLRLIDGMSMHEHYGFQPADTLGIFAAPHFKLVEHRRFQLGLNNLLVFERLATPVPGSGPPATESQPGPASRTGEVKTPGA